LTEGLRTGGPQNEIKHSGASMFAELYREPRAARTVHGCDERRVSRELRGHWRRSSTSRRYRTVCDVGRSDGNKLLRCPWPGSTQTCAVHRWTFQK
jgi:hypothetical protein